MTHEVTHSADNGLGHIFRIVPEKDMKTLYIKWPGMPGTLAKYRVKPIQYLGHVIGHEGQNSLLSTLIR